MDILLIMALAVGAMWLMTSRTRKQQKKAADFRSSLAPGQEVMTGSGLFGTIVAVDDETVTLETSPGVTSRWLRPAIAKLVEPPVAVDPADDDADGYDDEYDDDEYDDDEYDDEYDDDADDDSDEEPDAADVPLEEGALDDGALEIPDDASSLTADPDEDDKPRS